MAKQHNELKNMMSSFLQMQSPSGSGSLPSNTVANPKGDVKAITTRSGVAYDGPTIPPTPSPLPKEVKRETEATKDKPNPKPSIPYPTRLNDQKLCEKANNQMLKFLQIFQRLHFDISFTDALLHMPKFASTLKSLLSNKEELFELAKLDECLALADLGANINLMPLSVWKKLLLPEVTSTRMTLELANRSVAYPTFLHTLDELSNLDDDYYDTEGDILYLEKLLNEDPSPNLPLRKNEDLKQVDVTMTKPSIEEPTELELKDLPSHLEYAFLEGTDKLPVIISKYLKDDEKDCLLKVLKSHKRAIA
ncbi:hypothetical protein Tco_0161852 [Tanacetum coccineum]